MTTEEQRHAATVAAGIPCPACGGTGTVYVYSWPVECFAECAKTLRSYISGGQYWLCDHHVVKGTLRTSVLWTSGQRETALGVQAEGGS